MRWMLDGAAISHLENLDVVREPRDVPAEREVRGQAQPLQPEPQRPVQVVEQRPHQLQQFQHRLEAEEGGSTSLSHILVGITTL